MTEWMRRMRQVGLPRARSECGAWEDRFQEREDRDDMSGGCCHN